MPRRNANRTTLFGSLEALLVAVIRNSKLVLLLQQVKLSKLHLRGESVGWNVWISITPRGSQ
jgi:hypothetical protein